MAYKTRTRDPLLEAQMQAKIRKRLSELLGVLFVALGICAIIALWTYSPDDPNPLNATSGDVTNSMGALGATFASTMILAIGWASWVIPLAFIAWGIRLVIHLGDTRFLKRLIFLPVFAALASVYFALSVPPTNWAHSFGLGGFTGDAIAEFLIDLNLMDRDLWVKLLAVLVGIGAILFGLISLGFSWPEVRATLKRGMYSLMIGIGTLSTLLFKASKTGTKGIVSGAGALKTMREKRGQEEDGMPSIKTDARMPNTAKSPKAAGRKRLFPSIPVYSGRNKGLPDDLPGSGPEEFLHVDKEVTSQSDRVTQRIKEAIYKKKSNEVEEGFDEVVEELPTVEEQPAQDSLKSRITQAVQNRIPTPPPQYDEDGDIKENIFVDDEEPSPAFDLGPEVGAPPAPSARTVVEHPKKKPTAKSARALREEQPTLFKDPNAEYEIPALNLLASPTTIVRQQLSDEALEENARMLENVLDDYGVKGQIVSVRPGPVVTMYELEPAPGLKASRVIGLSDDIARSMSALAARVSTVPGKSVIGIELPNDHRETVLLREIISARDFGDGKHGLPLALGKDISGKPEVADLTKMPHLLIAGTTGSGKSVAINTMIMSLLYKLSPDECRLIMIDPKMLELSVYDGIPHLLSPVVTDPKKAVVALKWVVGEMEDRYRKMSKMGVRNIAGNNGRVEDALSKGENFERTVQVGFDESTGEPMFETESFAPEKMPYIVVVVDEMADLMMVAGKEIEACIQRLAQMARASGIHLIMATQRPSVDVITGTIKANFPTRISFQVTSKVDSRTILGEMGAEQLLGMGDMLYMAGGGKITRIHAPFVSDEEVEVIVNHLKTFGPPEYVSGVVKGPPEDKASSVDAVLGLGGNTNGENALYDQAVGIVAQDRKCSTSYIQRKLSIGYNKAAKLVEEMEDNGIVSAANHVGKREILLPEVEQ